MKRLSMRLAVSTVSMLAVLNSLVPLPVSAAQSVQISGTVFLDTNGDGIHQSAEKTFLSTDGAPCDGNLGVPGLGVLVSYEGQSKVYGFTHCHTYTDALTGREVTMGDNTSFVTDPIPVGAVVTTSLILPRGYRSTWPDPVTQKIQYGTYLGFAITPDEKMSSSLLMLSPNGGEILTKGKPYTVKWDADENLATVHLALYKGMNKCGKTVRGQNICGGLTIGDQDLMPFTGEIPNTGSYTWTPQSWIPDGSDYWLAVGSMYYLPLIDVSDQPFTINSADYGTYADGDLMRIKGSSTIYQISEGKRHEFPSTSVLKSWGFSTAKIKTVAEKTLASIPLGNPVQIKPGSMLVSFPPKKTVYEVKDGAVLRAIPNEQDAITGYGVKWTSKVIKLPEIYSLFYKVE